jgi:hypothetical protein
MSEPFLERLSRFTADAGGLDRDSLLFLAGRASARSGWLWKMAAVLLATTQMATLVLLWPRAEQPLPAPVISVPPVLAPETPLESRDDAARLLSLQRRFLDSPTDDLPPPKGFDNLAGPSAPLRGFSTASGPIVN